MQMEFTTFCGLELGGLRTAPGWEKDLGGMCRRLRYYYCSGEPISASTGSLVMHIRVTTYSGYKADERPLQFELGERNYSVLEILDRWYSPSGDYFRVRADDGNVYILRHDWAGDESLWTLEGFRRDPKVN